MSGPLSVLLKGTYFKLLLFFRVKLASAGNLLYKLLNDNTVVYASVGWTNFDVIIGCA